MALDIKTFTTRTITAIAFAAIMLTGLLWNRWSFAILFSIIFAGCFFELFRLLHKILPQRPVTHIVIALGYIALPITLMLLIRFSGGVENDNLLKVVPCGIIFSIWINDTMAYIVGSLIGKTPLSKISPKKTIEGTLGGMILAIVTITLLGWATGYLRIVDWIFISTISAVAGTFGDLLESKLKRMANVKDSGKIMPGHGGFLDRFDSMLVAIPFVFVYWAVMIN